MGEIAEMMLDGILCQCCGEYIGDSSMGGIPEYCDSCAKDARQDKEGSKPTIHNNGSTKQTNTKRGFNMVTVSLKMKPTLRKRMRTAAKSDGMLWERLCLDAIESAVEKIEKKQVDDDND